MHTQILYIYFNISEIIRYLFLFLDNIDSEQYILWLQNNHRPWNKVTELWTKTSKIRLKHLHSGDKNIQEYIKLYPALEELQGYVLVCIYKKDFFYFSLLTLFTSLYFFFTLYFFQYSNNFHIQLYILR